MKKLIFLLLLIPSLVFAQNEHKTETHQENGFTYTTVTNDPLKARIYTLSNGLKVYMTVYKDAPRIQTYIAVRAGSKSDPAYATGLAHYLEHILFKGTTKIGAANWEKEKPELDKIEALYEKYRRTTDPAQREAIYHQIDSVSLVAATFAIANEYDKMLSNIGASGTNAYTYVEQTVYVNDIPSNQIDKWAEIEAERFSTVVPRLFHTELEAVYEEKNKGLDNDRRKVWEALFEGLFPTHQYGTQTTIGTIEHLKNPSITEIKKYFDTYYVPNNMAICLSGDFNPEKTIQMIDTYFGKLKKKEVPSFRPVKEQPITAPIIKEIKGPDAESITIGFRTPGKTTTELKTEPVTHYPNPRGAYYLDLIAALLTNGQAGIMDLNLMQRQKVLQAYAYPMTLNDYSIFILGGRPLEGQSLEQLKGLLLTQLDSIKQGKFEDWLLKAVVNDYKMTTMKEYESNNSRADAFVDAFISYWPWEDYIAKLDELDKITKEELVKFANEYFHDNNYVVINKRVGTDDNIKKVPKPKISKLPINREIQSQFYLQVMNRTSEEIQPEFIDYAQKIKTLTTKNKIPVSFIQNTENDLFQFFYVWDTGKENFPKLALAVEYMDFLGTSDMSAEQLKKEFYKIGCSYSFSISGDQTYMSVSGLQENFDKALKLFEKIVSDPKVDKDAWNDLVQRTLKARADSKLSKDIILKGAMVNYGKYGKENPFTNIVSNEELKKLVPKELVSLFKNLKTYKHRVLYYGPGNGEILNTIISKNHKVSSKLKDVPPLKKFQYRDITENEVFFVNYDMVQSEIVFLTKSVSFEKELVPTTYLFNEYFGGSMGSLVFQEMREAKALAYSVRSSYDIAKRINEPNYITSYIGTQADKMNDAIEGLEQLIEDMPESEALFGNAKTSIIEMINSQRITKANILMDYEKNKRLGIDYDIRRDIYKNVKTMTMADIKQFQQKYLKGQKKIMLIIGSKEKINFDSLSKYGKVRILELNEIFGY